jgi:hypothetical protein
MLVKRLLKSATGLFLVLGGWSCLATAARADYLAYQVNVTIPTNAGYPYSGALNFEYNPNSPSAALSTATVYSFVSNPSNALGGLVGGPTFSYIGNVSGDLSTPPNTITMTNNGGATNSVLQGFTFNSGGTFHFDVDFSAQSDTLFVLQFTDSNGNTSLGSNVVVPGYGYNSTTGDVLDIQFSSTGAPTITSYDPNVTVSPLTATAVPEPTTWTLMLLSVGGLGAHYCWRRRSYAAI